jgi:predicted ATPase/DNA-binding XRE family transcriptional regulator
MRDVPADANPRTFADLIRRHRNVAGLTQEALAERAGLSVYGIQKLERGVTNPYRDTAQRLADALDLDPDDRTRLLDLVRPVRRRGSGAPDVNLTSRPNHNLPVSMTTLVGRERELREISKRLLTARLLTLTGVGGCGKTRLAMRLATDELDSFEHGVWFVALASVNDPALILPAIAHVLGLKEQPGRTFAETLKAHVEDKSLLFVLDNFEQLVAGAPLLADLLVTCRRLKILVTSRAVLGLYGEQVFPVPPLGLPQPSGPLTTEKLAQVEAVELFVQRTQAVRPNFALTDGNAPTVAAICVRLDGLPLAIELAAARVGLLGPDAVLALLERRLRLLTAGPRNAPDRHQTLRAAIAWSDDLLEPAEQVFFHRLAVNVAGWTLEAAKAVCNPDHELALDLLDGMCSLSDKSLVTQEAPTSGGDTEPRFGMLETVREFALEQLEASGESDRIRDRHARYYHDMVTTATARPHDDDQAAQFERLGREHENLRAALAWASQRGKRQMVLGLSAGLGEFWLVRGHLSEGRRWLEVALKSSNELPASMRARALHAAGLLAQYQGDLGRAELLAAESLELYRSMGNGPGNVAALQALARIARMRGAHPASRALYEESLAVARETGDQRGIAESQLYLGVGRWWLGDGSGARPLLEEALAMFRALGDARGTAEALNNLGWVSLTDGDAEGAWQLHDESLGASRELGNSRGMAKSRHALGWVAVARGEYVEAAALFERGFAMFVALGDRWFVYLSLLGCSAALTALGQTKHSAILLGTADAVWDAIGQPDGARSVHMFSDRNGIVAEAQKRLGDDRFAASWARGRAMTPEQAFAATVRSGRFD